MNEKEIISLMAVIKTAYPEYYREEEYAEDAARLWYEMFKDEDSILIGKAVKKFIKSDNKGYPPKIGQIMNMAEEIGTREWRNKVFRELQGPDVKAVPMPEDYREKLNSILKEV